MPKVSVEHVRALNDAHHELIKVSLAIIGHKELWGALRPTIAAVEAVAKMAMHDVDQVSVVKAREALKAGTDGQRKRT